MNFMPNPYFWPILGGLSLLLPVIVVMYLLKLKRRRVIMPSTLLWRRSVQDLVANAPFQKLRNNLLMWLQLLFLTLLILAFMRPVMELESTSGTTLVLLVDQSASMQTVESDGRTRLDRAKEAALRAVDSLTNNDEAIVVGFSDRTSILQTLTSDKATLRNAIESMEARDVETTLAEAGLILQGLTTVDSGQGFRIPRESTRTLLISDGGVSEAAALRDVPNLQFVRVGDTTDNLGIVSVDVRESYTETFEYEIFAAIANSGPQKKSTFLELEVEGEVVDLKAVSVPAGGTAGVSFAMAETFDGLATLSIETRDSFRLDDRVQVLLSPPTELDVLLVTNGNIFLERFLNADDRTRVSVMSPSAYRPRGDFDMTIFDGFTPTELVPGNYVFLNSLPPIDGFQAAGERLRNPAIIDWNRVHPLMRFTNFDSVLIGESLQFDEPADSTPLVEAVDSSLITIHETDATRVLVIGFDIFKSYWPLDVSFPIFMANLLDYYSRSGSGVFRPTYVAGDSIPIVPPREATSATVKTPDDRTLEFSFDGFSTAYLTETHLAGIYTVAFDNGTVYRLPVNLLSERESMIAPEDSLDIGGEALVSSGNVARTNREVWQWFILAALAIMAAEWMLYCRRTFM
jgi:hypothetical protein